MVSTIANARRFTQTFSSILSDVGVHRYARLRSLHSTGTRCGNVSMDSIKELRKRTGAPIGTVKKALEEQSGDLEAAIDHLRKLGASMAAKKAHREASEGLVGIAISADKSMASIVELNSETDFVARTDQFGDLLRSISHSALRNAEASGGQLISNIVPEELLDIEENKKEFLNAVSSLGENIVLKRASCFQIQSGSGAIFGYVHGAGKGINGRIGVLVALKGKDIEDVGPRLAMHIAAAAPSYTTIDSIPAEDINKERSILVEAARAEQKPGAQEKPPSVIEMIAKGRLAKWYSASVLNEQEMLVESSTYNDKPRTVAQHLAAETKDAQILGMCRFAIGDN